MSLQSEYTYTCIACQVAFKSQDHQRDHYKSDWHRYNLKRKVADLLPVTQENFAQRLAAQQAKATEDSEKSSFVAACEVCGKSYSSENAYANHLTSKKHKENEAKKKSQKPSTSTTSQASKQKAIASSTTAPDSSSSTTTTIKQPSVPWRIQLASAKTEEELNAVIDRKVASAPRLSLSDCLFCPQALASMEENVDHMAVAHSFFIPDLEYLVDLEGLLAYLGEKISVGNVCLSCNGKGRAMHSLEAVRMHMIEKGHCKLAYDDGDEMEYADYYDFSSTWEDVEDGDKHETAEGDDEDGEWEDVDENGTVSSSVGKRNVVILSEDGSQLTLPTGRTVVHRAVQQPRWTSPRQPIPDSLVITRVAGRYASMDVAAVRSKIASQALEREAKKQNKMVAKSYVDFKTRVGMASNRGYANRFFRDQLGFN